MAANQVSSFADLLAADSDFVMPIVDKDVQVALASFGAVFNKTKARPMWRHVRDISALLASLCYYVRHCCPGTTYLITQRLLACR